MVEIISAIFQDENKLRYRLTSMSYFDRKRFPLRKVFACKIYA